MLIMNGYIIALDQGTTSSRSIIFDSKGNIVSLAQYPFTQIYPKPGWVEHDPMVILESQMLAMSEAFEKSGLSPTDIAGIGIAICFRQGGSTGGTDIIAMIVNKYKTISYGRIVMTVDSMIILSSLFVGDMGVDSVIYGFVVTAVLGYTVDVIQAGNQQSSQIFVFTRRYEAMADQIIATTRHSATILDATGWYSKEDIKVVVVVCRKRETSQLLKLVRGVDGDAFISVGSVMGVYGKGFEALNKV